jgi:hypothetical protein
VVKNSLLKYKQYKRRGYPSKKLSKKEFYRYLLVAVVFTIIFIPCFIYFFFSNCVFVWPVRWDMKTCWHEQIAPSSEKAAKGAVNLLP